MTRTSMLLGVALLLPGPVMAQQDAVRVDLSGQGQFQFSTTSVEETTVTGAVTASTFETRRVRLTATMAVGDWLHAKITPDFALGRLRLADAWVSFALDPAVALKVGQFKMPFSLLELTSSSQILPIERGLRIRGLDAVGEHYELISGLGYAGRDIGASVLGQVGAVGYQVGVFNGSGADSRDLNDTKTVAGRLTYRPDPDGALVLGAAASRHDFGADRVGDADEEAAFGWGFEGDLQWGTIGAPGLVLQTEVALADVGPLDERLLSAQGILAYRIPLARPRLEAVELVGRASWGDPRRGVEDDEGLLLTPGASLYVHGRNRVMLNWDVWVPAGETDTVHALRAQTQVYF